MAARERRVDPGARAADAVLRPGHDRDRGGLRKKDGLTPEDIAAAKEQATEFASLEGVEGDVVGPVPSEDGQAMQTLVNFNFGANGWMEMPDTAQGPARHRQDRRRRHLHTGSGGQAADASEVFGGHRRSAAVLRAGHRDPDPAGDLPQPDPLVPADLLLRGRAHAAEGLIYFLAEVRRPHRQRAEPVDPLDPGHRRGHRLRPAARRALPRGAAPPRGPARGDGVRAAPCGAGDPRQRGHGRGRHALPAVRRDEFHRRSRPGDCDRRRRDLPRDGDAAAGPARDLRSLGVLAQAPDFGSDEPTQVGFWGRSAGGSPVSRARSGRPPRLSSLLACLGTSSSTRRASRPRSSTPPTWSRSTAS